MENYLEVGCELGSENAPMMVCKCSESATPNQTPGL